MFVGLDIGTSSAKAVLIDGAGNIVGSGASTYSVAAPRAGWAESWPEDWWQASCGAVRQATGGSARTVRALGLSGQMHGVVLSDSSGTALRPAVLWADTRAVPELEHYRVLGAHAREILANPIVPGMAGPILLWLRDHDPGLYQRARWALQPKDWLRTRLTGEIAGEPSDASATLLYNLPADRWATDIVARLNLRADMLPALLGSGTAAGNLRPEAAARLGLHTGIPVATGAGDTPAAAMGTGLLRSGDVQLSVGTAAQIVAPLAEPAVDPVLRTHLYRDAGRGWYAMAAMQNAGLALEWARGVLGATWEDVYREAFEIPPGAEGCTFLPYLTGERTPHLDPTVRGAWMGLSLGHRRGHLLRAALEGVAFAIRDGVEALRARGIHIEALRLAGGGTARPEWRRLLAGVLGVPLFSVPDTAASARGAALLAAVAAGEFASVEDTLAAAPHSTLAAEPTDTPAYVEAYGLYGDRVRQLLGHTVAPGEHALQKRW